MKKRIPFLLLSSAIIQIASGQNVGIGTTAPTAKLQIKGNADTSQLVIDANSTQSNSHPLIKLRNASGIDLVHIHSDNIDNLFVGLNAGKKNNAAGGGVFNTFIGSLAGTSNTTGSSLTALGRGALYSNTTGVENIAIGSSALYYNTTGFNNVAMGRGALYQNSTGSNNTAIGFKSLFSNIGGYNNTATGSLALVSNIDGGDNTATGFKSLNANVSGSSNTAYGWYSLQLNTSGYGNTGIGAGALYSNQAGEYNTAIGYGAGISDINLSNTTAIGNGAYANVSNKIRLGNSSVSVIEGQVAYSFPSDARFKYNIKTNVPGLDFIRKLRPVTYFFDEQKFDGYTKTGFIDNSIAIPASNSARQLHTGLLAQEVEKIAKEIGYDFDGIHTPANDRDHYSLAYSQFIMPLVKGMQEQQEQISVLKTENEALKARLDKMEKKLTTK